MVECRTEIGRTVVDARTEAELGLDPAAFVGAAGDADDPRAGAFGELADDGADRPRSGRDYHCLPALRLADLVEPDIGGQARHPEHAEGRR